MSSLRHNGTPPEARDGYLDAARACILDVGWRRTTLTEVARRAGVSRMTIYRTWPDMPTLLGDLMTREWRQVMAAATTGRRGPGTSDRDPVDELVGDVVATVQALRRDELFVRIVELDPALVLPYLLARRGRAQDHVLGMVERSVRAAQERGHARAGDPVAIARGVALAAHGHVLSAHTMTGDTVSLEALDTELTVLLTRGLRP